MARVGQDVADFEPTKLAVVATAGAGAAMTH
jgi:hypothetical protein